MPLARKLLSLFLDILVFIFKNYILHTTIHTFTAYRALITYDDLSPESKRRLDCIRVETKETAKRHGISYKYKQKKLISTLLPRYHYITNYLNLQLYLRLGMKLERVHKALKYEQRPFLRSFIDQMTQRRKNAKTKIEEGIW